MNMVSSIIFSRAAPATGARLCGWRRDNMGTMRARRGIPVRAWRGGWGLAVAGLGVPALVAAGCVSTVTANPVARPGGARIVDVVAAENFWGSLVRQLGGTHVRVLSLVSDPNADPHDYESSAQAARAVAGARYVVQNGAGYDGWMTKLLAANPAARRRVNDIGAVLGKRRGDTPHLWYNPAYVTVACDHIEAALRPLAPKDAGYFPARRAAVTAAFAGIREKLAKIRRDDAG